MNLFRLDATNGWEIADKTASNRGETSDYAPIPLFALRGCARRRCDVEPIGNRPGTGAAAGGRRNAGSAADTVIRHTVIRYAVIRHTRGPPFGCLHGGGRPGPL